MNKNNEPIKKENLRKSNQESKELTRQYIKTALMYLMKEIPFEKISVTAIINRAGVSRAGFYRNYGSKEEVIEDISAAIYEKLASYYLNDHEHTSPYERALFLFTRLKENADWLKIITQSGIQNTQLFKVADYVEKLLPPQTVEEHYQYIAITHSQRAIILDWFEHGMKESPEEMAEIFSNLYKDLKLQLPMHISI